MKLAWPCILATALLACGNEDPSNRGDAGPAAVVQPTSGPYFPLAVGNRWVYRVTPHVEASYVKTQTIEALEPVGGDGPQATIMAFRTVTEKQSQGLPDRTVSWQAVDLAGGGHRVVRYREQAFRTGTTDLNAEYFYVPYQLRWDESFMQVGTRYAHVYSQSKTELTTGRTVSDQTDNWEILAVDEAITVLGKSYTCIKFKKFGHSVDAGKTFWFARGIGKVKEVPPPQAGQIEELMDYTVMAP